MRGDHFFLGAAFFWAFWAALSWAFCWAALSLVTTFLSPAFLAAIALLRSLISRIASSARAFLSSGRAVLSLWMVSRVTPSIALYFLKTFCFLLFPASVCFNFLWRRLQAVVHLRRWALSFLNIVRCTSVRNLSFSCSDKGRVFHPLQWSGCLFRGRFSIHWSGTVRSLPPSIYYD